MKASTRLAILSAIAGATSANPLLQERARCNADNCARAITGTAPVLPLSSRLADCSSFLQVVVTPAASLTTITVSTTAVETVAVTVGTVFQGEGVVDKRQATSSPTRIPTYASACSGAVRYSSACSCAGITAVTMTAATPTSTITETAVVSLTTTVQATATITPGERPVCGSTIVGGGGCGCPYTVSCGRYFLGGEIFQTLNLLSELDCLKTCDSFTNCLEADYSRRTGVCNLYKRASETIPADPSDDAFSYAQGACEAITPDGVCQ